MTKSRINYYRHHKPIPGLLHLPEAVAKIKSLMSENESFKAEAPKVHSAVMDKLTSFEKELRNDKWSPKDSLTFQSNAAATMLKEMRFLYADNDIVVRYVDEIVELMLYDDNDLEVIK